MGQAMVSQVNLLKETVKVNLDSESSNCGRCYHNCEVCVLRNGKGSREGIEIPAERPERYVEESKESEMPVMRPIAASFEDVDVPTREKIAPPEEKSRRRPRRRGGRGAGGERPAGEKKEAPKAQKGAEKRPEGNRRPEQPPSTGRRKRNSPGRRTRRAEKHAAARGTGADAAGAITARAGPRANRANPDPIGGESLSPRYFY